MDLKALKDLTELKFQQQQAALAPIRAREDKLRAQLEQLKAQSVVTAERQNAALLAVGADLLWRGWVGRKRSELNIELAQVLAQKEMVTASLRRDHGRMLVSASLHEKDRTAVQKAQETKRLQTAISLALSVPKTQ